MRELCRIGAEWEGRFLMLCEPEGWYAVAVFRAGRQIPVLFSEDFEEVAEEIQYRSSISASRYMPVREYIFVSYPASKTIRSLGAEYDHDVGAWYVPDDLHNFAGTPLDHWRSPARIAFLEALQKQEQMRLKQTPPGERLYLKVPVREKDLVRHRGAVYDPKRQAWYIDARSPRIRFAKWIPHEVEIDFTPEPMLIQKGHLKLPMWLYIPTEEQLHARQKGAVQYQENGLWFAPVDADPDDFEEWDVPRRYGPKYAFLKFLETIGYDEERNDKVVADQQPHTFFVEGDDQTPSGKYCLFMKDGELPGGWASDARSSSYQRWSYPFPGLDLRSLRSS